MDTELRTNFPENEGGSSEQVENKSILRTKETLDRLKRFLVVAGLLAQTETTRAHDWDYTAPRPQPPAESLRNPEDQKERAYIEAMLGPEAVDQINREPGRKEMATTGDPKIIGLNSEKLNQKEIRAIFITTFPKGFVRGELKTIEFTSDTLRLNQANPKYGSESLVAAVTYGGERIKFFMDSNRNMEDRISYYAHELGHVNSPETDGTLEYSDRLELMAEETRLYFSGNRLETDYLADIDTTQHLVRLEELFSEQCRKYFTDPEKMQRDHPADFAIIDGWVKKHDEKFDPVAAKQARDSVLTAYYFRMLAPEAAKTLQDYRQQWLAEARAENINGPVWPPVNERQRFQNVVDIAKKNGVSVEGAAWIAKSYSRWVEHELKDDKPRAAASR